jgi:hypothetical protein
MGVFYKVQIKLPNGYIGEFVRIRVKLDVNKTLHRYLLLGTRRKNGTK